MTDKKKTLIGACLAALLFGIAGLNFKRYLRDSEPPRGPRLGLTGPRHKSLGANWNYHEAAQIEATAFSILKAFFDLIEIRGTITPHDRKIRDFLRQEDLIHPLRRGQKYYRPDRSACYDPHSQKILLNDRLVLDSLQAVIALLTAAEQGVRGEGPVMSMNKVSSRQEVEQMANSLEWAIELLQRDIAWIDRIAEWLAESGGLFMYDWWLQYYKLHREDMCLEHTLKKDLCYFICELDGLEARLDGRSNKVKQDDRDERELMKALLELAVRWKLDEDYEPLGELIAELWRLSGGPSGKLVDDAFENRLMQSSETALKYRLLHPLVERMRDFFRRLGHPPPLRMFGPSRLNE